MNTPVKIALYSGAALAVVLAAVLVGRKVAGTLSDAAGAVADAAEKIVPYVNPMDERNVFYSTGNTVVGAAVGNPDWRLGVWWADMWNPSPDLTTPTKPAPAVVLDSPYTPSLLDQETGVFFP